MPEKTLGRRLDNRISTNSSPLIDKQHLHSRLAPRGNTSARLTYPRRLLVSSSVVSIERYNAHHPSFYPREK
jgi:hypothetical protein